MSSTESISRFEELEAGRILGDLSPEEWEDWRELSESVGRDHDPSLELVAAALETAAAARAPEPLPPELERLLRQDVARFLADAPDPVVIRPRFSLRVPGHAVVAWAVAAVLAILLVAVMLTTPPAADVPSMAAALEDLRRSTGDLVARRFSGLGEYGAMSGEVVWSDQRQEGFMLLTNLPVNDPVARQYQLWIVDPTRDEAPVDGGVFDIPADSSTAIIRINAKLAITNPQAFVITMEQPGGVVKSKQETVVALAKV